MHACIMIHDDDHHDKCLLRSLVVSLPSNILDVVCASSLLNYEHEA